MDSSGEPPSTGGALTGALLVASPTLGDPNFERSVILLLDHGELGALGIVLNRPTRVSVAEILEPWSDQATLAPPGVIFSGGPVSREAVIGLGRLPRTSDIPRPAQGPGRWRPLMDEMGTVDLSVPPEDQPFPLAGARLFSGYAGWDSGQLEGEIDDGAWFVVAPLSDDLMSAAPDELWHDVLGRQPWPLAMLASYPPHPSVN